MLCLVSRCDKIQSNAQVLYFYFPLTPLALGVPRAANRERKQCTNEVVGLVHTAVRKAFQTTIASVQLIQ